MIALQFRLRPTLYNVGMCETCPSNSSVFIYPRPSPGQLILLLQWENFQRWRKNMERRLLVAFATIQSFLTVFQCGMRAVQKRIKKSTAKCCNSSRKKKKSLFARCHHRKALPQHATSVKPETWLETLVIQVTIWLNSGRRTVSSWQSPVLSLLKCQR